MKHTFYKYQGAGNDFIIFDARKAAVNLTEEAVVRLCDRHFGIGADGILVLKPATMADFEMLFFNPDGSTGMFCGNGGRCIAMFAYNQQIVKNAVMSFTAADGLHFAHVIDPTLVSLKMTDTKSFELHKDGVWIDTGTSHFVQQVEDVEKTDVMKAGRKLRNDKRFALHQGTNVNFYSIEKENMLKVRTYERGVEDETLACGTGITATALAYVLTHFKEDGKYKTDVKTRFSTLNVECSRKGEKFENVLLTGPAVKVFEGITEI
ncbi:MAG: diaminopimelate epimerase [Bacteroidales bacterium]|nr:diaminopimelate epimerase [Bacteroidales bacterium]